MSVHPLALAGGRRARVVCPPVFLASEEVRRRSTGVRARKHFATEVRARWQLSHRDRTGRDESRAEVATERQRRQAFCPRLATLRFPSLARDRDLNGLHPPAGRLPPTYAPPTKRRLHQVVRVRR